MAKVVIAGSRSITDYNVVDNAIRNSGFIITEVISGGARGVDYIAMLWATTNHIPYKEFPADWDTHGKSAGYKRNKDMADYAEACIVVWDGESKGSKHMIDIATKKNIEVYIEVIR